MQSNKSNGQLTAQINLGDHKKSGFDLSNNVLGTGRIGRIIPTRALHVMPGDTIKADSKVAVQFEPLAVPILANMDVKQEHFYVPYNVVWKNWDKFISGGEKLDYNGIVPNATIFRYYSTAFSKLSVDSLVLTKVNNLVVNPDTNERANGYTIDNRILQLASMKLDLDSVADTFQIKDILAPQYKVIEMLGEIDHTLYTSANGLLFEKLDTDTLLLDGKKTVLNTFLNKHAMLGNKYIEEISPAIYQFMDTYGFVLLPTPLGFEYISLLYEYVKPFVGLGSNLDYLNMCRLTLSEYIISLIVSLTMASIDSETSPGFVLTPYGINSTPLSILNLRANYNIWYNNYRDILLEENAIEPYDGDDITDDEIFTLLVPRQRCWEKDAFTTALDNPGTGSVGVPLNISRYDSSGDVIPANYVINKANSVFYDDISLSYINSEGNSIAEVELDGNKWRIPTSFLSGVNPLVNISDDDIQPVQGFSLYALDAARRAQIWLQKALFFGNRISDFYYMRFGVRFLDARLRLPELLTSSSELVKLDVVMNNTNITTEAGGEVFRSIAGDRAAYASAYDNGNSFDRFCEEHGVIMSYLTIMPQITYAYGINRDYSRLDQFDFAFAEFATLGMDAVYDTEITATSFSLDEDSNAKVFGYQGRYYDYKAKHSEEHGELLDSQDMYTFARKFNMFDPNGRPKLNYEFVHCFPSLDMFVVDDMFSDYFRYDIRHSTAAERELPAQSIYI